MPLRAVHGIHRCPYRERRDTYSAIAVLLKDLRCHRRGVVNTPHASTEFTLVFLVNCDVAFHKRNAFYLQNLQQIYLLPANLQHVTNIVIIIHLACRPLRLLAVPIDPSPDYKRGRSGVYNSVYADEPLDGAIMRSGRAPALGP